jgi:hypothetical protein
MFTGSNTQHRWGRAKYKIDGDKFTILKGKLATMTPPFKWVRQQNIKSTLS